MLSIIMSLYEQFYSDINKNYMFDMINDIILKKTEIEIKKDPQNYELYVNNFDEIFNKGDYEEITDVNQVLLDYHVKFFIEKIEKATVNTDLSTLMAERKKFDEGLETPQKSSSNIDKLIENINNDKEIIDNDNNDNNDNREQEKTYQTIHINSSKRTNINSSRFNYKLNLKKNNIDSNEMNKITKMIVPLEDNYLFNIPILTLTIPELEYDITLQQENVIEGLNRKFGIYHTIENHTIDKKDVNSITIDIRDISGTKYQNNDNLKVNIINVINSTIAFTCSHIHKDNYKVGDNIKIINNNSFTLFNILQDPLRIKKIENNIIYCRLPEKYEESVYDNIDMKIMNISNQNIIYFN